MCYVIIELYGGWWDDKYNRARDAWHFIGFASIPVPLLVNHG